ncbi:hypothetical protein ACWGI8_22285 [Streptomyces sp. NPDC054841]
MSARLSRRLVAATTVTAAAAIGATLVPFTAYAAPVDSSAAPLTFSSGLPQPAGALTRGGAGKSFTFTVKNASDKPQDYWGSVFASAEGPAPINAKQVKFDVEELSAPDTDSGSGSQDQSMVGAFYPAGKGPATAFKIPAKGELSWKVTVALSKDYPSINGDLKVMFDAGPDKVQDASAGNVTFDVDPEGKGGSLEAKFGVGKDDVLQLNKTTEIDLSLHSKGAGVYDYGLGTSFELVGQDTVLPKVEVKVYEYGQWVRPKQTSENTWGLPVLDGGFGNGATHTYKLRLTVKDLNGVSKDTTVGLRASTHLVVGNTYPLAGADAELPLKVAKGGTKPSATPSPSTEPSATATPSASAGPSSTSSASSSAAVTTTSATSGTSGTSGGTATTTGALARTGSSSTTWYAAGAAAVLLAAGGALTALRLRRR